MDYDQYGMCARLSVKDIGSEQLEVNHLGCQWRCVKILDVSLDRLRALIDTGEGRHWVDSIAFERDVPRSDGLAKEPYRHWTPGEVWAS